MSTKQQPRITFTREALACDSCRRLLDAPVQQEFTENADGSITADAVVCPTCEMARAAEAAYEYDI